MKRYIIILIIINLFGINCSVIDPVSEIAIEYADYRMSSNKKIRKGETLMVQKVDNKRIAGELIAVRKKNESLLLLNEKMGEVSIDIRNVKSVQIYFGTRAKEGATIGLLTGGLTGVILGFSSGDDPPGWYSFTSAEKAFWFGLCYGAIGSLVGLCIGSSISNNVTILIEGRPDTEIIEILEGLRKLARIPEFQ